jgi:hypothetical protein
LAELFRLQILLSDLLDDTFLFFSTTKSSHQASALFSLSQSIINTYRTSFFQTSLSTIIRSTHDFNLPVPTSRFPKSPVNNKPFYLSSNQSKTWYSIFLLSISQSGMSRKRIPRFESLPRLDVPKTCPCAEVGKASLKVQDPTTPSQRT